MLCDEIGGQKIRTDKKHGRSCSFQFTFDVVSPFRSRLDVCITSQRHGPLSYQRLDHVLKPFQPDFILMTIADKDMLLT